MPGFMGGCEVGLVGRGGKGEEGRGGKGRGGVFF